MMIFKKEKARKKMMSSSETGTNWQLSETTYLSIWDCAGEQTKSPRW